MQGISPCRHKGVMGMIRKMLYKSERKGGGYTVSLIKPEGSYQVRWRLIAEETEKQR